MSSTTRPKPTKFTFYTSPQSPFAQRVDMAFKEVGLEFDEVFRVNTSDKPSWFVKEINPEGKIPVISIEGKNIAESLVLIELAHDLKPEEGLLPTNPVKRAQIRFAIEYFGVKFIEAWAPYMGAFVDPSARPKYFDYLEGIYERFNELLLEQAPSGPYFLGSEYSLADIAIAPFISRNIAINKGLLDGYEPEAIKKNPRLQEFLNGITSRPSFKETYVGDEPVIAHVAKILGINKETNA
ncbi:glutathione S-transferase [Phascolomyces articulosus]|uniref:Glutathione S-transferase n=1 Tax=Phascolomyces articulosus TaxID=60185 RepID=A0AAD5P935_9FUNG|nr:glutathione S-transferase [Phascolomyces articulosus]